MLACEDAASGAAGAGLEGWGVGVAAGCWVGVALVAAGIAGGCCAGAAGTLFVCWDADAGCCAEAAVVSDAFCCAGAAEHAANKSAAASSSASVVMPLWISFIMNAPDVV